MTIAACYFSPEAVILGADSTTTFLPSSPHGRFARHFNHAQKLFAVGQAEEATLGVVTWGLAELGDLSHRTLVARLNTRLMEQPIQSVAAAAQLFADVVWSVYAQVFQQHLQLAQTLAAKLVRDQQEEATLEGLKMRFTLGYCIGGTWWHENAPCAYELLFDPLLSAAPNPTQLVGGHFRFWGCPNMIDRVLYGIDGALLENIRQSPHWKGTVQDLDALVQAADLNPPDHVPLREAIDFVHAAIYTTIRAFKFSRHPMLCGGPIELAVISSDRPFRWVRHKTLDHAVT